MKTRPDTTPEMISMRINCKIKNICAVSGSHPSALQLQECDEMLWEVLPFWLDRHGGIALSKGFKWAHTGLTITGFLKKIIK